MKRTLILLAVIVGLVGFSFGIANHVQSVIAQDKETDLILIDKLVSDLRQEGIPVNFNEIKHDINGSHSSVAEFILQSSSNGKRVSPDDPIYINKIFHKVDAAQNKGLNIDATGLSIINTQGEMLFNIIKEVNPSNVDTIFTSHLSADEIKHMIENMISNYGYSVCDTKVTLKEGVAQCGLYYEMAGLE